MTTKIGRLAKQGTMLVLLPNRGKKNPFEMSPIHFDKAEVPTHFAQDDTRVRGQFASSPECLSPSTT